MEAGEYNEQCSNSEHNSIPREIFHYVFPSECIMYIVYLENLHFGHMPNILHIKGYI